MLHYNLKKIKYSKNSEIDAVPIIDGVTWDYFFATFSPLFHVMCDRNRSCCNCRS